MFTGISHHVQVFLPCRCCQEYETNVPGLCSPGAVQRAAWHPLAQQPPVSHRATAGIQCKLISLEGVILGLEVAACSASAVLCAQPPRQEPPAASRFSSRFQQAGLPSSIAAPEPLHLPEDPPVHGASRPGWRAQGKTNLLGKVSRPQLFQSRIVVFALQVASEDKSI